MAPGTTETLTITRQVWGANFGLPPGEYFVGVELDRLDEVPEQDDTNNILAVGAKRLSIAGPTDARSWMLYR